MELVSHGRMFLPGCYFLLREVRCLLFVSIKCLRSKFCVDGPARDERSYASCTAAGYAQ